MDDKTLVERLDTAIKDDHERGCQGRYYAYSCTCGYDNDCSQAMQDAKSRIEALEAALREAVGLCWNCGGDPTYLEKDDAPAPHLTC